MKNKYDASRQDSKLYQHWNKTTAMCYYQKMCCELCPNDYACSMNTDNFNKYGLRQVKFAALMTYANKGKPRRELINESI